MENELEQLRQKMKAYEELKREILSETVPIPSISAKEKKSGLLTRLWSIFKKIEKKELPKRQRGGSFTLVFNSIGEGVTNFTVDAFKKALELVHNPELHEIIFPGNIRGVLVVDRNKRIAFYVGSGLRGDCEGTGGDGYLKVRMAMRKKKLSFLNRVPCSIWTGVAQYTQDNRVLLKEEFENIIKDLLRAERLKIYDWREYFGVEFI